MNILSNYSLAKECTFKCGGNARWFCMVESLKEFENLLKLHQNNPLFILGNGSNTLCSDKGYSGLVICTKKLTGVRIEGELVECESGVNLFKLNQILAENGLTGLEWSYGIPATIGGAAAMNAGSFGYEIGDFIEKIEVWDGKIKVLNRENLNFSYRNSNLKGVVILKVWLRLKPGKTREITAKMQEYLQIKQQKQPLGYGSAGSVFKRKGEIIPAKIIENLGLKGFGIGGAEISEVHSGFIINKNGATATDIVKLVDFIKNKVKIEIGIDLEEEIILLED